MQKSRIHNSIVSAKREHVTWYLQSDDSICKVSSLPRTGEGLKLPGWEDNQTEMDLEQIQMFIKEVVDKIRLSVVARLRRRFWDDTDNVTEKTKH